MSRRLLTILGITGFVSWINFLLFRPFGALGVGVTLLFICLYIWIAVKRENTKLSAPAIGLLVAGGGWCLRF